MSSNLITIIGLLLVNIALASFSYGKLSQKVADLCRRMGRVEGILSNKNKEENVTCQTEKSS